MVWKRGFVVVLMLAILLALPVVAAAVEADDDIPGVPLPASPVVNTVNATADPDDVFSVSIAAGEKFTVAMIGPAGTDYDLYLFKPGSPSLGDPSSRNWVVAWSELDGSNENLTYTATVGGTYYLDVWAFKGSGSYSLTWSIGPGNPTIKPVYRFYNVKTGVHFYTADESEKLNVWINLWQIYYYEGVSYQVNMANPVNSQSLYRFYNAKAGVHFYTASDAEKASVIANLSHIYKYEGVAYKVSVTPTPMPVWRFYNFKKGVHFYTADANEKNSVVANLSWTYKLDGIGYYIGQ